jgi:hypothetical protein
MTGAPCRALAIPLLTIPFGPLGPGASPAGRKALG